MARGRPKGSKNKPKIIENPGPGHNSELTDEQLQVLVFQHKKEYAAALVKKKEADAALKNVCKKAKAELGAGAMDDIKLAMELDSDEGQARLREKMEREARVARWFGMDVGTQGSLFGEDRAPRDEKIRAEGKRAGLAGVQRIPPTHYAQQDAEHWYLGYDDGQKALRDQMEDRFIAPPSVPEGDKLAGAFDDVLDDADEDGESDEDETEEASA